MVNLEPIPKVIQERLFEKMNALGRITSYPGDKTDKLISADMNSRSTFIKMCLETRTETAAGTTMTKNKK